MYTLPDLLARSVDGVCAIGADQTLVFWNAASEALTGIPARRALGRRCHEVLNGQDLLGRPLCRRDCPVGALSKGGPPPASLPMRITHADGRVVHLHVGTLLMPAAQGEHWDVVHVLRRGRGRRSASLLGCPASPGSPHTEDDASPGHEEHDPAACQLTVREREVLHLLADGSGADAMALRLNISITTVRNHIQRLLAKLNVHSRLEAVAYAHRHRLV